MVSVDPTSVSTLSRDPYLTSSNQNLPVSLNYAFHDYVTIANASIATSPPWHLDRINQQALPLDGYYASNLTGVGVHIHMLDTSIQSNHSEFLSADGTVSRVIAGKWSFNGTTNTEDCNGHGTATASLAAGRTVGTAPNATIHAVRVIGCGGDANIGDIIVGLDYVVQNAQPAVMLAPKPSASRCNWQSTTQCHCTTLALLRRQAMLVS